MEQIPQEIYDRIATHLGDTGKRFSQPVSHAESTFNRPVLATTSRKWQCAIERRSFRALELRSTELDEFETIMTSTRRRYLRVLRYYIVLPAYPVGSRQLSSVMRTALPMTRPSVQQYTASFESSSLGKIKAVIGLDTLFSFTSLISTHRQIIASVVAHMYQRKRNSCLNMAILVCDTDIPTFVF